MRAMVSSYSSTSNQRPDVIDYATADKRANASFSNLPSPNTDVPTGYWANHQRIRVQRIFQQQQPVADPVRLDQRPANQSNGHVFAFYIRSFGAGNGSAGGNSPIASETVTVQPPSTPSGLGHQHRDQVLRRGRPRPDTRDDGRPPARIHLALPPLRPVCLLARHGGSYRLNIQSNRVRSAPWPSSFQHNGGGFLPPWGKIEQWLISVQHDEADIARFTDNFAKFAAAIRT